MNGGCGADCITGFVARSIMVSHSVIEKAYNGEKNIVCICDWSLVSLATGRTSFLLSLRW